MQVVFTILVCGANAVIQLSHFFTGFDIGRVFCMLNGLFKFAREWQKKIVIEWEFGKVKQSSIVHFFVVGRNGDKIGGQHKTYFSSFEYWQGANFCQGINHRAARLHCPKVHFLRYGNITLNGGKVALGIACLNSGDGCFGSTVC